MSRNDPADPLTWDGPTLELVLHAALREGDMLGVKYALQQTVQGDAKPATNRVSRSIGTGNLGHAGTPTPYRLRPDLCPRERHPGVTYHPQQNRTWCLCGQVTRDGDTVIWPKADGIGGPLREELQP